MGKRGRGNSEDEGVEKEEGGEDERGGGDTCYSFRSH